MFSKDLEYSIGQCYKRAREARDEYMTVEHLLLALMDNPSAEAVLKATSVDFQRLRGDLEQAIATSVSKLDEGDGRDTQPTLGFQRVLQRAVYHVQSSGKKEVTGANVLVAIFGEKDSHAVYYLNQQDVTRLDVVNYLSHGIAKTGDGEPAPGSEDGEEGGAKRRRKRRRRRRRPAPSSAAARTRRRGSRGPCRAAPSRRPCERRGRTRPLRRSAGAAGSSHRDYCGW